MCFARNKRAQWIRNKISIQLGLYTKSADTLNSKNELILLVIFYYLCAIYSRLFVSDGNTFPSPEENQQQKDYQTERTMQPAIINNLNKYHNEILCSKLAFKIRKTLSQLHTLFSYLVWPAMPNSWAMRVQDFCSNDRCINERNTHDNNTHRFPIFCCNFFLFSSFYWIPFSFLLIYFRIIWL